MKITSNYKTGEAAFYVAEAESRKPVPASGTMLRKPLKLQMIHLQAQTGSTYIGTTDNVTTFFNYNGANRVSSIQAALDYTVRIKHATNAAGEILYYGDSDGDGIDEKYCCRRKYL